jgi:tRNA-dihydrouridine synthase B
MNPAVLNQTPSPRHAPEPLARDSSHAISPCIKPIYIGTLKVDPPILQAPMAGFTNYAFRQIVREYGGTGLQATEMVNARGFVWLDDHEAEHPDRLWGVREEARPLAVQIWDNQPETLAKVGKRLAEDYHVSVVDINFGCPVKQVTEKAHSGSYLLRYPERMGQIIERVVSACAPTPVTAKIRLGCTRDNINAIDIAQVVEGAGAAALTVHGRTAQDMFRGSADWNRISEIKPYLKKIPLIGNGDLDSAESVVNAFRNYDVDGVMIARACLGRPWLFAQAAAALRGEPIPPDPSLEEQRLCLLRHFDLIAARFGVDKGAQLMRRYACCYAQGRRGARFFRTHVANVRTAEEFYSVVDRYFPREENAPDREETDDEDQRGGSPTGSLNLN